MKWDRAWLYFQTAKEKVHCLVERRLGFKGACYFFNYLLSSNKINTWLSNEAHPSFKHSPEAFLVPFFYLNTNLANFWSATNNLQVFLYSHAAQLFAWRSRTCQGISSSFLLSAPSLSVTITRVSSMHVSQYDSSYNSLHPLSPSLRVSPLLVSRLR